MKEKKYYKIEPILHSHVSDVLPDDHKLAFKQVNCNKCKELVHAGNNECMQTWFETEYGNYCTNCWKPIAVLECLEENL